MVKFLRGSLKIVMSVNKNWKERGCCYATQNPKLFYQSELIASRAKFPDI